MSYLIWAVRRMNHTKPVKKNEKRKDYFSHIFLTEKLIQYCQIDSFTFPQLWFYLYLPHQKLHKLTSGCERLHKLFKYQDDGRECEFNRVLLQQCDTQTILFW